MLVLTRKQGEAIVIGKGDSAIRLIVVKTSNGRVQLVIDAPKEIPIKRGELVQMNRSAELD